MPEHEGLGTDLDLLVRNVQVALGALDEGRPDLAKVTLIEALDFERADAS